MHFDFFEIVEPVAVRIRHSGIRSRHVLLQVAEPVAVGIAAGIVLDRIQPLIDLPAIGHAVAVRIAVFRIGSVGVFLLVGKPVAVGIAAGVRWIQRIEKLGPAQLVDVVDAVAIGIQRLQHVP